jgi:hypothetical protein
MRHWRRSCDHGNKVAMRRIPRVAADIFLLRLSHRIPATIAAFALVAGPHLSRGSQASGEACPRPPSGSVVGEPADLHSKDGVLRVDLTARNVREADGRIRYCFVDGQGHESPNLRVDPGDLVILHLKNGMSQLEGSASTAT